MTWRKNAPSPPPWARAGQPESRQNAPEMGEVPRRPKSPEKLECTSRGEPIGGHLQPLPFPGIMLPLI